MFFRKKFDRIQYCFVKQQEKTLKEKSSIEQYWLKPNSPETLFKASCSE
ncbi:hypothetical protein CKA32_006831 [Geitlerinema sp. FC II]|nr:hypothetical protein CKA32_006831 [Geitlerinema sp. FC II]